MLITLEKYPEPGTPTPPREWVMVLHLLMKRTSPVLLRKRHLPAAPSMTGKVVHRLKASSITKMFYLKSGKPVCTATTRIPALNGVLANSER